MKKNPRKNVNISIEPSSFVILTIIPYAIQAVVDLFSSNDKINTEIEKKLINYKVKEICEDYLILEINKIEY